MIITVGLLLIRPLQAQETTAVTVMQTANQLYETEQYAGAVAAYEQLVKQGVQDSALFYNLGNAYFKQGDVGRAILNYNRAARLAPRDADIQANRELARAQAVDKYDQDNRGLLATISQALARLTLNEVAGLSLALWLLLGLLIFRWRGHGRFRESLPYLAGITAVLALLAGFALGGRVYVETTRPEAVVVAAEVDVTSGPGDQYVTEFTLHSGAVLELMETRGRWARLQLPGGHLQGWVPAEAVERVVKGRK
jgi:hypothetical protein